MRLNEILRDSWVQNLIQECQQHRFEKSVLRAQERVGL